MTRLGITLVAVVLSSGVLNGQKPKTFSFETFDKVTIRKNPTTQIGIRAPSGRASGSCSGFRSLLETYGCNGIRLSHTRSSRGQIAVGCAGSLVEIPKRA
jgi:hypothetical protein